MKIILVSVLLQERQPCFSLPASGDDRKLAVSSTHQNQRFDGWE
ncbi:hypothetical protein [Desmonostoc muscorum]|nr:hypothetical protein [Desmonostoc muscorum]